MKVLQKNLTCVEKNVTMKNMENTTSQQQNIGKRLDAFFDKHYAFFFAPLIVAILYMFALWQYDVYPFGDKYTAASYDLSAQICPFIEHLFDVFDGKSTLTFSYAIVGGADVTGTLLYFFVSPFSFLFLIFGDGKVAHASSIVMLFKMMSIAFAGTWFAKKLFKDIPDYLCIMVGVVYAYCGYTFVSNTYINWMDFLIYLPFTVGAFKRFVKTGKFLRFSILVACCIYTCFSIACFSLFTVFPALIIYGLLCIEKERKHTFIAYLCLAFAVAILMALPVLFPALGAYTVSGRGGGLFENLWKGYTLNSLTSSPENFNSSTFIDSYSQSLYRKWSYILSDSIFVILTIVWFYRNGLKGGFAKFMLVAGVLTLLPTVVDESMNLLNMGSYMSYALRFGFLNALYFLGGACLCLESICYKPLHAFDGTPLTKSSKAETPTPEEPLVEENLEEEKREENKNEGGMVAFKQNAKALFKKENTSLILWSGALLLLGLLVAGFLVWFVNGDHYKVFVSLFSEDRQKGYDNLKYFSSSYAHSLGGLEVVIIFFCIVAIVAAVGCCLVGRKKITPFLFSIVMVVIVGLQVTFYNGQLVVGNRSTQHEALGTYQTLSEELNARDDSYFRVKDYGKKTTDGWDTNLTACAPFTGNANSFSVFSSVIDADNFVTFQLFGYLGNGKNSYKSAQNTNKKNRSDEFGDSFLGYKYYFVPEKSKSSANAKTYLKPVPALDAEGNLVLDENGKEVQLAKDGYLIYENTIVFPLGYRVDKGGFIFRAPNTNNSTNRKKNQQALYRFLRGEELGSFTGSEFVTPESATELSEYLWDKSADVKVEAGKITAKVTAEADESLLLSFVAVKGYTVTVNGKKAELVDNDLKFLLVDLEEGENEVVFTYTSPYIKYMAVGVLTAIVLLVAVAFVVTKTKLVEKLAPVISWAGILLAVGVVAFFMLFPSGVFIAKVIELVKGYIPKIF